MPSTSSGSLEGRVGAEQIPPPQLEDRPFSLHQRHKSITGVADGIRGRCAQARQPVGHALAFLDQDVTAGKVTIPMAKAMSRLSLIERRELWETLSSKPDDPAVIAGVIEQLESCGALEACDRQARELVESAWLQLEPLLRDSRVKVVLRAFGWYVLDRNY